MVSSIKSHLTLLETPGDRQSYYTDFIQGTLWTELQRLTWFPGFQSGSISFFISASAIAQSFTPMGRESESRSAVSDSLWPHGLPNPWNSLGQNTGVGSLSLLQGIFPTQESNQGLLHCRQILYQLCYWGSPQKSHIHTKRSPTKRRTLPKYQN